jgi:hypothetical protein
MDVVNSALDWVMGLGAQYGVNPVVFGAIYVGAIPFFILFTGLAVKRMRARQSAALLILAAGFCFISAYLYLAIVGHDIPAWVWGFLGVLVAYGAWSAVRSFRARVAGD